MKIVQFYSRAVEMEMDVVPGTTALKELRTLLEKVLSLGAQPGETGLQFKVLGRQN